MHLENAKTTIKRQKKTTIKKKKKKQEKLDVRNANKAVWHEADAS